MTNQRKLCIVGAGGFGREVLASLIESYSLVGKKVEDEVVFLDDNPKLVNRTIMGVSVIPTSDFISSKYDVVIAVGDPQIRKKIVQNLPQETHYKTLIHPSSIVMEGSKMGGVA